MFRILRYLRLRSASSVSVILHLGVISGHVLVTFQKHNHRISQRPLFILVKLFCNSIWMLLCDSFYGTAGSVS